MGNSSNALYNVVHKIFNVGPGKQLACKHLPHELNAAVSWYILRCIQFPVQEDCNYRQKVPLCHC